MGSSISQLVAMAGGEAVCRDISEAQLERGRSSVETSLARFAKSRRLTEDEAQVAIQRITFTLDLGGAVADADVVIEAVPEILELKQELLAEIRNLAPSGALLGTNTSQLSITNLATALGDDAPRLVGIHFFNPPVMMRLVELIAGIATRETELDRAVAFAEWLGREVVVCRRDSPGFITSRAYAILRLECVRMLEEGVATAEDIDKAMRLGFNFPLGPLELGDMNGIDTFVHALDGLERAYGDRFHPTVGLRNMIAAGRLGRKAGTGFYEYGQRNDSTALADTPAEGNGIPARAQFGASS
jgi:3-hydroxybutyryl-CoA dehydrogenase